MRETADPSVSDVFISYAHEDATFVERLQAALASRGCDAWVDSAGIEPADRWRPSAEEAIDRSDALLFVISADSLRSEPCLGELHHATAVNKRIIPVCVDEAAADIDKPAALEELSWIMMRPGDDFDAGADRVVHALRTDLEVVRTHTRILVRARAWDLAGRRSSPLLRGDELRLAEHWLASAAATGSTPTQLQQDFINASRRAAARRLRAVAGVATAVAVVAIALSIFALIQRNRAVQQASLATSRQLAALSESSLSSNLQVGLLLAVRAYRTDPNPQTRSALLQADLYSPLLAQFLSMGGRVVSVAGNEDGSTVVAGLANGEVMRWRAGARTPLVSLGGSVASVAISASGQTVAAATGKRGMLWRAGMGVRQLSCPGGQGPTAVAVSPSGDTLIVHCQAAGFAEPGVAQSVEVASGLTGSIAITHPIAKGNFFPNDIALASDSRVLLFDGADGPWQVRTIPDWALASSSTGTLGVHQGLSGYSGDGRYVTATNDDPTIPVWPTSSPTDLDPNTAPLTAQAPLSAATALTISPGGGELAVADSGTIYVSRVTRAGAAGQSPAVLPGNGSINENALSFFGNGLGFVSATADTVASWNLTQFGRLARAETTRLQAPCDGCQGALTAISPDGRTVAAVAADDAVVQGLAGGSVNRLSGYDLGPPLWDGDKLLLPLASPVTPGSGATRVPAGVALVRPARALGEPIAADALMGSDRQVAVVDTNGNIYLQSVPSGRLEHEIHGPRDLTGTTAPALQAGMAAIDAGAGLAAIVDNGVARLIRLPSGTPAGRLPGTDAEYVAFAGSHLLVQRTDGTLEVWNTAGTTRQRVLAGDQSYDPYYPVADPTGNLVARQRANGSVTLADLSSGAVLATLAAPVSPSLGLRIGLAFAPGGQALVTVVQTVAGYTPQIIERLLGPRALVRSACATAGRSLTPGEWRTFVGTTPPSDLACR